MSIVNNGISVSGNVVVSGLITSTGGGFSGIGANLTNIPISAINELRLELNGGTTELSVTRDTLNATIVSEARFGSNYTNRINSELNTRVDNTSNYVNSTSNILIGRIINTSNYVDSTSNFLSGRIDNTSNYVFATSNILIGRIINTSNYIDSTSNFLSGHIDNTSNYVFATSNILIGRIINTSNYVDSTSNFLGGRIDNTSNYVFATSNILIGRVINTSNYVESTSNILIGRIINTCNYVDSTSNFLSGRIDNTSNYVFATSNILIGRIINTSNYVLATSNILADYNNLINKPFQFNGANIFNNSGNVGIGTNATPLSLLEIITANYAGALLTLDAGIVNSTTQMPRSIGRPLLKLGKTSVSTSAGDYYGIGFGISPTLSDYNCAEIGTIITSTTGLETGDIIFSTRPVTNNVIATERMRITSTGNVGIGTTDTTTYKLNVGGTLNTTALYVNGTALTTTIGLKQDVLTSTNTIGVFNTTTDFVVNGDKIELTKNTSNYVIATSNLLSRRIDSTSNYSDKVGVWGSNYTDRADIWGSNYSDRVGGWGSNYTDKADIWGSNYSDKVGGWGSNYAYDKVGVWSSNYTDRVGGWGSNYAYDKVGMYSSNYTDRIGERGSNYVLATSNILIGRIIQTSNYVSSYKPATAVRADTADKFTTSLRIANVPFDGSADISISYNSLDNKLNASTGINIDVNNNISANYVSTDLISIFNTTDFADVNSKIELSKNTSNYVLATSNILIGRIRNTCNYVDSTSNFLGGRIDNTSNYVFATSNILIGRIINTSNYVDRINTSLTAAIASGGQWTTNTSDATKIYYNGGNVGIGTTNPQSSYKLQVQGNTWVQNQLVFNNSSRGEGADFACNKIALYNGANTPTTTGNNGFGLNTTGVEYFSGTSHIFYTGTTGGTGYGTERLRITTNGNVGIGTANSEGYKLNVAGTFNTTGLYVNGTQITESSKWTGTEGIYNTTTGNVGIGTSDLTYKLNTTDNISIRNSGNSRSLPPLLYTTNPSGVTSGTIGDNERFYIFTHTGGYNRNTLYQNILFPPDITVDLFMIGGGGAGGGIGGAGGGSGACLIALNQKLYGIYTFAVGGGGSGGITSAGNSGYDTYISGTNDIAYKARGGGGGAADAKNGIVGGCSGGAAGGFNNTAYTSPAPATDNKFNIQEYGPTNFTNGKILGNKGGNVAASNSYEFIGYGGGGGIGAAAANADGSGTRATTGGDGLYQVSVDGMLFNLRTYFTNNGTFGVQDGSTGNYYIGGGGGGGGYNPYISPINIAGGKGGGGIGKNGNSPANGTAGTPNTGSGGGGGSTGAGGNSFGGNGGSGLLIFRYRLSTNNSFVLSYSNEFGNNNDTLLITNRSNSSMPNRCLAITKGGNVDATGTLTAGAKNWRIKHPILSNKYLLHTCIEGTRADNIYRGRKQLIDGECEVNIDLECNNTGGMTDGTFVLINKNVQVYVINNDTYDRVVGKINGNKLTIKSENNKATCFIDWLVLGERCDEYITSSSLTDASGSMIVEIDMENN